MAIFAEQQIYEQSEADPVDGLRPELGETSTLTETDPVVLTRTDPASARCYARKGVKGTVE